MSDGKLVSVLDFGSSKIRLGIFKDYLSNSKFISEIESKENLNQNLQKIVMDTEKGINQHMNNLILMFDDPNTICLDFVMKKNIDKMKTKSLIFKNIVQEAKQIIEENNHKFKILHVIISQYILDGKKFNEIPEDLFIEEIVIELKFILTPTYIIKNIKQLFKNNQISINNFYNSTYVKTLSYTSYFENFETKVFIDIGFKKTSITVYQLNKIVFLNFVPIGGNHITKDISKVLKKKENISEDLKKSFNQTDVTFINDNEKKDLLIKVIHARVEEIIDLCLKNFLQLELLKKTKSILIFTGEGSKILSKNSIYLKEEYNVFDDMNFFEENSETICTSGFNYENLDNHSEAIIIPKKQEKRGIFEKLFYIFSR